MTFCCHALAHLNSSLKFPQQIASRSEVADPGMDSADLLSEVCGFSHLHGRTADVGKQVYATGSKNEGTKPECL